MIIWDLVYSMSEPNFLNFLLGKLLTSNLLQDFQGAISPYCLRLDSHMARYAGSPVCIMHADMTFARSKVKVKVMRR